MNFDDMVTLAKAIAEKKTFKVNVHISIASVESKTYITVDGAPDEAAALRVARQICEMRRWTLLDEPTVELHPAFHASGAAAAP